MRMDGPVVLSIAGYDPSSGAGVTADVKTISAFGCYALTCITALTVQNTLGVQQVEPVAPRIVSDTLRELAADFDIAAIRIGMLGSGEVADVVADFVTETSDVRRQAARPFVVLDPIIKSSSGADLLDVRGLEVMRARLVPLSTVVTPNIDEAEALAGMSARSDEERRQAGERILNMGAQAVVITGGHLDRAIDLLTSRNAAGEVTHELIGAGEKIESPSTHGTGCAFATALACGLTSGQPLPVVVSLAKAFVAEAIRRAHPLGRGHGPMNLLWNL